MTEIFFTMGQGEEVPVEAEGELLGYLVRAYRRPDSGLLALGIWPANFDSEAQYLIVPIERVGRFPGNRIIAYLGVNESARPIMRIPIRDDRSSLKREIEEAIRGAGWTAPGEQFIESPATAEDVPSSWSGLVVEPPDPTPPLYFGPWSEYGLHTRKLGASSRVGGTSQFTRAEQLVEKWREMRGPRTSPSRHVNIWFVEARGGTPVPRHVDLAAQRPYLLRLSIGELDSKSIVHTPAPFPAELLPPSETGNWLDVAVASDDFRVPNRLFPIFLPSAGPAWVCPCTPGGPHTCDPRDRAPVLDIAVVTPARTGIAQLRLAIYCNRNIVQSQRVRAAIVPPPARPGQGTWSVIDYTLTTGLTEVDALPAPAVSFLTNEDDHASHLVMFNDDKHDVISFHLTEAQMSAAVTAARQALLDAHIEVYGGKLGAQVQRKNRYNARNAKSREDFKGDLRKLAEVGRVLWDALFGDQRERARGLRHTALARPAVIQVARAGRSTYVFPWALLYELPIEPGDPDAWWFCPIVDEWDPESDPTGDILASCPYERRHDELNVLCPYGFWGVRHVIEQPPSVPRLALQVTTELPPPRVVMVKSKQLDTKLTDAHITQVTNALPGFLMCPADSRPLARKWLGADAMELIYFYCHGLDALLPGAVPQPYLGIGVDDRLVPGDIGVWFEQLWSPQHWERTAPLIFINGCHTVAVTTSSLVQFVDAFAGVRAAGVVGTEITLHQRVASEAGAVFLQALRRPGASVGEALRTTRLHLLRKGNVMGLAYTAYCSATLGFAGLPPIQPAS